ncbi:molybdenum cofactor biosynthesis protein MoaA [Ignicoccus islandicus DSM 13165]|uniref:Molybdenum cofactor biosynthesis protein MoaA n=1 Tax=Ignicoccus islandicus DSM 13165 TaxID=940295 RepID=A0A0U3EAD8_9CREN|nr:molybdopterin molybdotransferase MoeA [Ignicoccus islandicus]ALU11395.1 molybdenum cofactor biosynthesis protein MoaA [Ignicoccus islandicus DSM 13165]
MGLTKLNPVEKVINEIYPYFSSITVTTVRFNEATSRYSAQRVVAVEDNPPVPKSVLDGFAVNSEDVFGASEYSPIELEIGKEWKPGVAVYVNTGDPLPQGTDTVIPIEAVKVVGNKVLVFKQYPPGNAVAKIGEDLRKGETIIDKGVLIRPWHVAALASQGIIEVDVIDPKIAVAATGDEIVEPWEGNGVRNSTAWLVASFFRERIGSVPSYHGILRDDEEAIKNFVEVALDKYDIVITTGGSSVGKRDISVKVMEKLADKWIHGVALTPGRPLGIGVRDGKLMVSLSGYPVAALSQLEVVVWPIIKKAHELKEPPRPKVRAKLKRRLPVTPNMLHLYRVVVCSREGELWVEPLRLTGSGILSSLIKSNGIVVAGVRGETGYDAGDEIEVELIGDIVPCK